MNNPAKNIDEYIAQFPQEIQTILTRLRETIHQAAPTATEKISYRMPTFFLGKNLVHFAAFKQHIGFYPGASGVANFEKELIPYKWAKGSIQFPIGQPLPWELITRIVKYRVKENTKAL